MKQRRNTKQRQLILDLVRSSCDHPSADQIYLDARAIDDNISRGTVYRNLNLLVQQGELLHVKISGTDRFDCRLDFHHHVLCTECGTVRDVPLSYHGELDPEVASKTGYIIEKHSTVFEGICPDCQHKSKHNQN